MSAFECPPVLIVGFNRPEVMKLVLDEVRKARPKRLFLALDYPRDGRPDDKPLYEACKKVFDNIDWPCEVKRNYADKNMGCGERMQSAITWTFEFVDRAIILEDDVVADQSFFCFCAELLERYKDDTRVGMISGCDEHRHMRKIESHGDSYFFDRMTNITGWATWKRAWDRYDPEMKDWPYFVETRILENIFPRKYHVTDWIGYSGRLYRKERKTWAGKWAMTMYREHWLSVHPFKNLVTHMGTMSSRVDEGGNITCSTCDREGCWPDNLPRCSIEFPLHHPRTMIPNTLSEFYHMEDIHSMHWWRHIPTSPADFLRKWKRLMKRLEK